MSGHPGDLPFTGLEPPGWELKAMNFYGRLFDSDWREHGDFLSRERQGRHYNSMAEQVMANRTEIQFLQSEVDRVSQDLARALLLNRTLVKLLLSQGVCSPETLEELMTQTVDEAGPQAGAEAPSRFCEECGRPLPRPGQACPYCAEVDLTSLKPPAESKPKKRTPKKKKKKKKADE